MTSNRKSGKVLVLECETVDWTVGVLLYIDIPEIMLNTWIIVPLKQMWVL